MARDEAVLLDIVRAARLVLEFRQDAVVSRSQKEQDPTGL